MPRKRNNSVYSIYHNMDDRGVFDSNPANAQAVNNDGFSIYKGPVEYPKMLYHPQGKLKVVFQGLLVTDPKSGEAMLDKEGNPRYTGTQVVVEHVVVASEAEAAPYIAEGWHETEAAARRQSPDKKIAAAAPPKTKTELMEERIKELERQLADADAQAAMLPLPGTKPFAKVATHGAS